MFSWDSEGHTQVYTTILDTSIATPGVMIFLLPSPSQGNPGDSSSLECTLVHMPHTILPAYPHVRVYSKGGERSDRHSHDDEQDAKNQGRRRNLH